MSHTWIWPEGACATRQCTLGHQLYEALRLKFLKGIQAGKPTDDRMGLGCFCTLAFAVQPCSIYPGFGASQLTWPRIAEDRAHADCQAASACDGVLVLTQLELASCKELGMSEAVGGKCIECADFAVPEVGVCYAESRPS